MADGQGYKAAAALCCGRREKQRGKERRTLTAVDESVGSLLHSKQLLFVGGLDMPANSSPIAHLFHSHLFFSFLFSS